MSQKRRSMSQKCTNAPLRRSYLSRQRSALRDWPEEGLMHKLQQAVVRACGRTFRRVVIGTSQ